MSKQKFLLSAAASALLFGSAYSAYADTTISSETSTPLYTAHLTDTSNEDSDYTYGTGSISITSAGSIKTNTKDISLITVNSNSYVYSNGLIQDNDKDTVYGIHVNLTDDDDTTVVDGSRDMSALTITKENGSTVTGAAIYLDSSSVIKLAGSSGSTKGGIWLDGDGTDCKGGANCVLTGDIVMAKGADIYVKGSSVRGIHQEGYTVLKGNLLLNGTIEAYQTDATSTSSSSLYAVYLGGTVEGDIKISNTATLLADGSGSSSVLISGGFYCAAGAASCTNWHSGSGVTGALTIDGAVIAEGIDTASSDYSRTKAENGDTVYPEGSVALTIGSGIDHGIGISATGTVKTIGTGEAILISPTILYGSSNFVDGDGNSKVISQVIGLYADAGHPGFAIDNAGAISISPSNTNVSATAAIKIAGGGSSYPTIITGGIYNSGIISAAVRNYTDTPTTVSASGLYLSGYVYVGGSGTGGSYATPNVVDYTKDGYTCSGGGTAGLPTCSYSSGLTGTTKNAGDEASLVNKGTISVTAGFSTDSSGNTKLTGTGAASTTAIYISSNSRLSSILNSGTIAAVSEIDPDYTDTVTSLSAAAIVDYSGTLTYIKNTGTIEALTTTLDNDAQLNIAIYLYGNTQTDSGKGVTIINQATDAGTAAIVGDVHFGDGDNQQIYLEGTDTYASTLTGDITYGGSTKSGSGNGDLLYVGKNSTFTGKMTATNGVNVVVKKRGTLNLLNDKTTLKVSDLVVESGGTLNINVSEEMEDTGAIDAYNSVTIADGAVLGVNYGSIVPGSKSYLLIRADKGNLSVADLTDDQATISKSLPFLFKKAAFVMDTASDTAYDKLYLDIDTKSAADLKLSGYAAQIFDAANIALEHDEDLGSAMVNSIGSGSSTETQSYIQTQKAYNSFAPNVTGGTRAIAISITDQATGVVSARQRALRTHDKVEGDLTLWGQAFAQTIHADGQGDIGTDGSYARNGFKDKGFGVALGADTGSPRFGWYGLALTMYNGNVEEIGRNSHQNQLWVVLSGYTSWQGRHLFIDTKLDAGYGRIHGKRFITLTQYAKDGSIADTYEREADSSYAAAFGSGGITAGAKFSAGGFHFLPQVSLDGLLLRENKYIEGNPDDTDMTGDGFDLAVRNAYSKSLRGFVGATAQYEVDFWGAAWRPEVRGGVRYDFLADPIKVKAAFKDIDVDIAGNQNGEEFTLRGPDPSRFNVVGGAALGIDAGSWSLHFDADYVRGKNGQNEKVGTVTFVHRL